MYANIQMATALADYKKIFEVYQNTPNTVWVSRSPDKTLHICTFRPRYVDERLGKVSMPGTSDSAGRIITEFNRADVEIGFEVQNQFDHYIVVRMFDQEDVMVADFALKPGEKYFFDNRNKIDKRRFSLKRKVATPGGAPIPFATSSLGENLYYRFVIKHQRRDEWPAHLMVNMDNEIKVPYVAPPVYRDLPTVYPESSDYHRASPLYRSALPSLGTSWGAGPGALPLPSGLPVPGAMPPRLSARPSNEGAESKMIGLPLPSTEAFVAEQVLGGMNKERLGSISLDLDPSDADEVTFVCVLRDF